MAPMTRTRAANKVHKANELMASYYEQRASAGLYSGEGAAVNSEGVGYIYITELHTQPQIEGWKKSTEAVHKKDGINFTQLYHAGRNSYPSLINRKQPLARPSRQQIPAHYSNRTHLSDGQAFFKDFYFI